MVTAPAWDLSRIPEEVISAMEAEKLSLPMYEKLYAIQHAATKRTVEPLEAIFFFIEKRNPPFVK